MGGANYDDNVFINCPFDAAYQPMFQSLVFCVRDCGFVPRCALEVADSAQVRINKIMDIMAECRYGIHDISRTETDSATGLPRFNMPLELGIFLGCRRFGDKLQQEKVCVILDRERYRYQKFVSDIAGQEVESHRSSPEKAVRRVRDFLRVASRRPSLPGGAVIWERYETFRGNLPSLCRALRIRPDELTFVDLTHVITEWLSKKAPQG